jgi:rubrerythrin
MNSHDSETSCQSGDHKGIGVYLCTRCNFALASVTADYILPDCPCCENSSYKVFLNTKPDLELTD